MDRWPENQITKDGRIKAWGAAITPEEIAGLKWARIWYEQIWISCSHWGLFPLLNN